MSVLQTEASFVSFCHFGAIQTQQVIVRENLHAVVMSGETRQHPAGNIPSPPCSVTIWDCGVTGWCCVNVLPVTLVPDPGLVASPWPEICLPVVLDLRGEAEKAAVGAGVGGVSAFGQALLLQSTLQHVHGSVLQVGGLLNKLGIENQIWGSWEADRVTEVNDNQL